MKGSENGRTKRRRKILFRFLTCFSFLTCVTCLKQPSVIAEVISGIILGPTVMGRIPGFLDTIFPEKALPIFNVIANLGLIFFMSLIGLELDFELMVSEWKRTTVISVATMVIPFAVSIGSSFAVWDAIDRDYIKANTTSSPEFGTYLLFMYALEISSMSHFVYSVHRLCLLLCCQISRFDFSCRLAVCFFSHVSFLSVSQISSSFSLTLSQTYCGLF